MVATDDDDDDDDDGGGEGPGGGLISFAFISLITTASNMFCSRSICAFAIATTDCSLATSASKLRRCPISFFF